MKSWQKIVFIGCLIAFSANAQQKTIRVQGLVLDSKTGAPIEGAGIRINTGTIGALSDKNGHFVLNTPKKALINLYCRRTGYENLHKEIRPGENDSVVVMELKMNIRYLPLDTVPVVAVHKPETLVGKADYSVFDFDFYEDKLLLLTAPKSLNRAQLQLADYSGKIYSRYQLPGGDGENKYFYHDFEGYTNLVCRDTVLRLDVMGQELLLTGIGKTDFELYLKPVADTANGNLYYSNYWEKFPSFNYYYLRRSDTVNHLLNKVTNEDLLKLYNMEYYYLPSRMQLEARRMADYYNTDVHIVAALMSGFTQSMFYEALYAPLFIIGDTICIFNHHNDYLYHYDKSNRLLDSVKINYHHPKHWREWKKKLYVDESLRQVYAFFSKSGHHYLKRINHHNGQATLTYKLQHHSAEKIKIKDGYVYYVYRPFGSTQEKFLYRERIE